MEKGENAGYPHFLLFPLCFQNSSFSRSLKGRIVWKRVNSNIDAFNPFPNKPWFLAPLDEGQRAIVMALCPPCVRPFVRACVRKLFL